MTLLLTSPDFFCDALSLNTKKLSFDQVHFDEIVGLSCVLRVDEKCIALFQNWME